VIDHINRIKGDNRIKNLRDVSHFENVQNVDRPPRKQPRKRPKRFSDPRVDVRSKTGLLSGVSIQTRGKPFGAKVWFNGKMRRIGSFNTELEAYEAVVSAKQRRDSGLQII
jgi:hypothetical protein